MIALIFMEFALDFEDVYLSLDLTVGLSETFNRTIPTAYLDFLRKGLVPKNLEVLSVFDVGA